MGLWDARNGDGLCVEGSQCNIADIEEILENLRASAAVCVYVAAKMEKNMSLMNFSLCMIVI